MSTQPSIPVANRTRHASEIEALVASIGEGLIATDDAGKITRINKQALDMFGFRKVELLGNRLTHKIVAVYESGKPIEVIDTPIAKSFMMGQTISERALYKTKDGSILPVQVTVSPLLVRGRPVGAVQLFRDITTEIQMEKMKSDFISLASHQLRTPLSSVNIYAGMLRDGLAGGLNELQTTFVETILQSALRMNELIDTLLNIARIEAKGVEVSESTLAIDELVRQVVKDVTPSADAKHLQLYLALNDGPMTITSDAQLIKEALVNLLTNAIKYTPESGHIEIQVKRSGNNTVISIRDTGYGIPARVQKQIFTKFFRADNILLHDVSGTGLGLYLTKMIAQGLKGDLWFESIENKGSTFYLSLPTTM
ncbi:MAG TPA: PAS domain-containing sensor histidine kinase [Verrucomicrobiae bacterium]|nr:PAS domain-containing sensor histidine kinase [Verrucomicrobiae bacterium]